jgi:hypothetical protein
MNRQHKKIDEINGLKDELNKIVNSSSKNEESSRPTTNENNLPRNGSNETNIASLKVPDVPSTYYSEFGKFILNHIEKEEKFRLVYEKQIKPMKAKIIKIFEKGST